MKEDDTYLSMPHDDTFEFILPRVSHDSKSTNQYGKWLIDLCMDNQLYILNGRTLGDMGGKFTCHTPRGSSAVDYLITSNSLSNEVLSMNVSDFTLYSDHCFISMKLKIYCENFADEWHLKNENDLSFTYLPDKILWKEVNKVQYQEVFQTADIKARLADINKQLHADNVNVQTMVDSLTEVMVLAGNKSLVKNLLDRPKRKLGKQTREP